VTKKGIQKYPDPYLLIGNIYQSMKNDTVAVKFLILAAQADPKNVELWKKIALMSQKMGDLQKTLLCYDKIIRLDPNDVQVAWERCTIFEELGDTEKAVAGYATILKTHPGHNNAAKELAKLYHMQGKPDLAIQVLEKFLETYLNFLSDTLLDLDIVNMLCELYMAKSDWTGCIRVVGVAEKKYGEELALDLVVKFGICQVHLGEPHEAERCFSRLQSSDMEEYSDLFITVAEAYENTNHPELALHYYQLLQQLPQYDTALVRAKEALCLSESGQIHSAIDKYLEVLQEDPHMTQAVLHLASLYKEINEDAKAIQVVNDHIATKGSPTGGMGTEDSDLLSQITYDSSSISILLQKGYLHFEAGEYEAFVSCCLPIALDPTIRTGQAKRNRKGDPELGPGKRRRKKTLQQRIAEKRKSAEKKPSLEYTLGVSEYFLFLARLGSSLDWVNRTEEAVDMLQDHLIYLNNLETYPLSIEQSVSLYWLLSRLSTKIEDYESSLFALRHIGKLQPENWVCWNEFTIVSSKLQPVQSHQNQHQRFLTRFSQTHPTSKPLLLALGHQSYSTGCLKIAIDKYLRIYSHNQYVPLPILLLCLGVGYLLLAMSRNSPDRNTCVLHGFSFMSEYFEKSYGTPEACYNLGRAYHQLSLYHLAIPLYEKVLQSDDDIKMEAAFNLAQIYYAHSSPHLARKVLMEHVII